MHEKTNISPLSPLAPSGNVPDGRRTMVKVDHVSMVFNMANEQLNSLKEYAIAVARRELMFKEFRALNDVSFEVHKGDVFGILGTNGSGKSTMLKIIAGVLEPTEGSCTINGNIAPLIELGAGFDLELTARENIYLNGALLGYSKKFIQQHFDEIVEFAEIKEFLDMPMKNYSSGMVARIAFAIATVIIPEILIVDEVLSVGDFMFQQKCERRITQLIKEHDVTVLIVSHNNDQIERLCNRAIWIEKGHTRMMGTALEVCRTYRILGGHVGSSVSEQHVFNVLSSAVEPLDKTIDAIGGENRYGTASKLMGLCHFLSDKTVIIAPGELSQSCMVATSLSGLIDAPVLLTKSDELPDVTVQALRQILPEKVIIVGGQDLISNRIAEEIDDIGKQAVEISRIEGNAIENIALNAFALGKEFQGPWSSTAVLAYGDRTPDLLSVSPYVFKKNIPLFFAAEGNAVEVDTASVLRSGAFERILVFGGSQPDSDEFLLSCKADGIEVVRFDADGPYNTNELINNWMLNDLRNGESLSGSKLIVASVWDPSDALCGGIFAGKTNCVFLLEDPQDLDSVSHALDYIEARQGKIEHLTFLGSDILYGDLDKEILGKAMAAKHIGQAGIEEHHEE